MNNSRSRLAPMARGENSSPGGWLAVIHAVSLASGAIADQAILHGQLAKVEWAQEKHRLTGMLLTLMFGFGCFISLLGFAGILVIALSWATDYRVAAIVGLCGFYGLMLYLAWLRLLRFQEAGAASFAGTRAEIAADIALFERELF